MLRKYITPHDFLFPAIAPIEHPSIDAVAVSVIIFYHANIQARLKTVNRLNRAAQPYCFIFRRYSRNCSGIFDRKLQLFVIVNIIKIYYNNKKFSYVEESGYIKEVFRVKETIRTTKAPAAIGPYSQGIRAGGLVFISGQLPLDPVTGEFSGPDIESQTRQSLLNVSAIAEEAGTSLQNAVKVTVYLTHMSDFAAVNRVYTTFFHENCPARVAVEVSELPKGARIEIDAIAVM